MPSAEAETIAKLQQELDAREAKVKELTERLAYALATVQNTEKLMKQEVAKAKEFGVQKFAVELLDVHDNLTRALKSVKEEDRTQSDSLSSFYDGVQLTSRQLEKAFTAIGVKEFSPENEVFDAKLHEALFRVPGEPVGHVAQVIKTGFMLNSRCIRPAQVGVFHAK